MVGGGEGWLSLAGWYTEYWVDLDCLVGYAVAFVAAAPIEGAAA